MDIAEFEALLDRQGPDLARWDGHAARRAAEALLSSAAEARHALAMAVRLDELLASAAVPPAPSLSSIVALADKQAAVRVGRASPPAVRRSRSRKDFRLTAAGGDVPPTPIPAWWRVGMGAGLGLGRWYALALSSCLLLGIAVGVGTSISSDVPDTVYDMVDGSHAEGAQ